MPRGLNGPAQHDGPDDDDQGIAAEADGAVVGRRLAGGLPDGKIHHQHDDDRGQDMGDRDHDSHGEAFAKATTVPDKIRDHHRLAMPGAQRVHEAVAEGDEDREPERLRAAIVTETAHGLGEDQRCLRLNGLEPAVTLRRHSRESPPWRGRPTPQPSNR